MLNESTCTRLVSLDVLFTSKGGRKMGTNKNKKVYFRSLEDVDKIVNALSQINSTEVNTKLSLLDLTDQLSRDKHLFLDLTDQLSRDKHLLDLKDQRSVMFVNKLNDLDGTIVIYDC